MVRCLYVSLLDEMCRIFTVYNYIISLKPRGHCCSKGTDEEGVRDLTKVLYLALSGGAHTRLVRSIWHDPNHPPSVIVQKKDFYDTLKFRPSIQLITLTVADLENFKICPQTKKADLTLF